jgi:hypothetical protein
MIKDIKYKVSYDDSELKEASAEWKKHNDLVSGAASDFKKVNDAGTSATRGLKTGVDEVSNSTSKFGGIVKSIGPQLLAAFSIGAVVALGKEIYNITSRFQTLEAVLTNTLGSNSAAQRALGDIKEFAANTPFSVEQLTDSYVKLANQGFTPTVNQLRQLGDLASSTGKGFDQLAEAILDAQTGEFERLKEFGIKASKNGDQLSLSFKGVKTEIDNTSASIQQYILGLGDIEGVTGSMAAISETAAGQVSNLGDAFDSLLTTLGSAQSGIFSDVVGGLSKLVKGLEIAILTEDQLKKRLDDKEISANFKGSIESIDADVKKLQASSESADKSLIQFYKDKIALGKESIKNDEYYLTEATKAVKEAESNYELIRLRKKEGSREDAERAIKTAKDDLNSVQLSGETSKLIILELENRIKTIAKAESDAAEKQLKEDDKNAKERLKRAKELTKALEDERKKGFAATSGDTGQIDDLDKFEADKKRREKANAEKLELEKRFNEEMIDTSSEFVRRDQEQRNSDAAKKDAERKLEEEKEKVHQENIEKIKNQSVQTILGVGNAFFQMETEQRNARLADIQQSLKQELKLAGDNKQEQAIIQNKYAVKERQLKRQQAVADKEQAIFNILLNTAVGVTKALGSAPPPANFVLAALVGALGGVQLVAAASKPLPKFKRGTKSVPGVDTGEDTILAMLRPKEKVFSVETSQKYTPALDAIFDHKVPADLINSFVLDQKRFDRAPNYQVNNYEALEKKLDKLIRVTESKPVNQVNIDKNGLETYVVSSNNKTKTMNNYFVA